MKYLYESFEEFKYRLEEDKLTEELFVLVDESLTHSEINDITQVNEIFGLKRIFRSLFTNPGIKRKIKVLVDDLIKLRVEIAKISLEFNEDEFEDEYSIDDKSDGKNKPTRDRSPRELKKSALEDQVEAIEAKMDLLVGEDERLLNYLKMQRLDAKIKANDLIYKLASSEQQKILKGYNKEVKKEIKGIEGILDESEIMNESEAYIEVSVRDARKALNHLDDIHKRKYKTDGSNYYIFKDEEEAYDALQHFEDMGIEVLDHNISESLNESDLIKKHLVNIKSGFNKFIENVKKENRETKEAFAKIIKSVKDGEKLTREERKEIGDQMKDVLKLTGFTAASVLPGGMIYILLAQVPALKKTLTPSAFLTEDVINVSEKTWTGKEVARHIEDITPEESDVPTFFIDNYVLPNTFILKKVDLKKLLKTDPSFKDYYDSKEERYYQDEVNPKDLDYELVIHKGELLDGYSRASMKIRSGERYTYAFVSKV